MTLSVKQKQKEFVFSTKQGKRISSKIQGQDEIIINAPIERVWSLIVDSTRLEDWGPPVKKVELIGSLDQAEGVGTYRRIDAEIDGKQGYFIERRLEQVEGERMAFVIEEESFGIFRVMSEPGTLMELEPVDPNKTRVIWTFFHNPKGLMGHILNPLIILRQQRNNRLAALDSLKKYAEKLSD